MLLAALEQATQGYHGLADAVDRLRKKPTVAVTLKVTPGTVAQALTEEIRAGRAQAALDLIKDRVKK